MIRRKLELGNHYRMVMIVSNDDKFTNLRLTQPERKKNQPLSAEVIIKLVLLSVIFSIYAVHDERARGREKKKQTCTSPYASSLISTSFHQTNQHDG